MGNQPWYATKEGRAEFGRRCAERDAQPPQPERDFILEKYAAKPNEFQLCNQRANAAKAKAREAARMNGDWWRIASRWIDGDIVHDPTHNEVMIRLLMSCPDWHLHMTRYVNQANARWMPYRDLQPDGTYRKFSPKDVLDEMLSWSRQQNAEKTRPTGRHTMDGYVFWS